MDVTVDCAVCYVLFCSHDNCCRRSPSPSGALGVAKHAAHTTHERDQSKKFGVENGRAPPFQDAQAKAQEERVQVRNLH